MDSLDDMVRPEITGEGVAMIDVDVDTEPLRSNLVVDDGWLFDSKRGYLEQFEWYRSRGR